MIACWPARARCVRSCRLRKLACTEPHPDRAGATAGHRSLSPCHLATSRHAGAALSSRITITTPFPVLAPAVLIRYRVARQRLERPYLPREGLRESLDRTPGKPLPAQVYAGSALSARRPEFDPPCRHQNIQ